MHGVQRGGASCHSEFVGADGSVRPFPVIPSQCEHWRGNDKGGTSGAPSPTRGSTYRPVGRGPCAPPKNAYPAAGHMGPALQVHTPPKKKQRGAPCGAPRVFRPCVAQTEEGYIRRLMQAGTALSTLIREQRCTRCRRWPELRTRPCSHRPRSWCQRPQPCSWPG